MALRAMNNKEKNAAKMLKEKGFDVFWFESGPNSFGYYALHPKLTFQYCINTCADIALNDLKILESQAAVQILV
jgi:hypothetical protein